MEDRVLEAIYEALDEGQPEVALEAARAALEEEPQDPVLHFLSGVAYLELDRAREAIPPLRQAVALDTEDAELRAQLALALFRSCEFEEARREVVRALALDESLPDAHAVMALLLERGGRFLEADAHEARAERLDPERFPPRVRLDRSSFEKEIVLAGERLPARFRQLLGEVGVSVEEVPPEAILREEEPPLDPELLGLFVGEPLTERSVFGPGGALPPRVLLFKRSLERHARDAEELRDEIAVTLYHELGHYLGLDEQELEDLELG